MIELAALPPIVQEYIQEHGTVELRLSDGQVIATPKRTERPFNFDIDELDKAIHSGFTPPVPKEALKDVETFEKWLASV